MQRANAFIIALLLGTAVVVGSVAALKTAELKSASGKPTVSRRVLAHRSARLDRAEIALRKALARHPPKLPSIPRYSAVASPQASAATAAPAPAPRIIRYVRPAPIVVTTHRAGGDEGDHAEHGHDGGDHEGGRGGDD